jgi:hypothetical protein
VAAQLVAPQEGLSCVIKYFLSWEPNVIVSNLSIFPGNTLLYIFQNVVVFPLKNVRNLMYSNGDDPEL